MTQEVWMISNRQPWVEALVKGKITCKTRSLAVHLPPVGSLVYLHASKALWSGWRELSWVWTLDVDVPKLRRGGVYGIAEVLAVGRTEDVMPTQDKQYFMEGAMVGSSSSAGPQTIRFTKVRQIPFIECRGSQVPTRKLPPEVQEFEDEIRGKANRLNELTR